MGAKTSVPIEESALPTAAAQSRNCPRRGVGNDSAAHRKVATLGRIFAEGVEIPYITTKSGNIVWIGGIAPPNKSPDCPKHESKCHGLFLPHAVHEEASKTTREVEAIDDDLCQLMRAAVYVELLKILTPYPMVLFRFNCPIMVDEK